MRLLHENYIDWDSIDRATKDSHFDALRNKYSTKNRKIRVQIASRILNHPCRRSLQPISWPNIHKIIGGKYDTVKNWGRKIKGFNDLWKIPTHELQNGQNFTNPRNPKLEIALIQHVLNCNSSGFMLDYDLFKMEALKLDSKLRQEAAQLNQIEMYPTAQFVCSNEFFTDFKKRNKFRTRKVGGQASSVDMLRSEVINYLNDQIQVENANDSSITLSIENIDPSFIINLEESAIFTLDLGIFIIK